MRRRALVALVGLMALGDATEASASSPIAVGAHSITAVGNTAAKSGPNSAGWEEHSDPHSDGGSGLFTVTIPVAPGASNSSSTAGGPAHGQASATIHVSATVDDATGAVTVTFSGSAASAASAGPKADDAPLGTALGASGDAGGNTGIAMRLTGPVQFAYSSAVTGDEPDKPTGSDQVITSSHGVLRGPNGTIVDTSNGGAPAASGTLQAGDYSFEADGGVGASVCCLAKEQSESPSMSFSYTLTLTPLCDHAGTGAPDHDTDGDGLCDGWETNGIDGDDDGTLDLQLPGASPGRKDLYLEIDYMKGHKPDPLAIADVIAAFAGAPVANPDGSTGITLHVVVDDELPHGDLLAFEGCADAGGENADFDALKDQFFGTAAERSAGSAVLQAKHLAFRYGMWAHLLNQQGTTSGCSEIGGNDFVVSLGGYTPPAAGSVHTAGTRSQQAATFMHEFGHTLGLHHGGGDDINCKPNYLSVMSYFRQFVGSPLPRRPLDYSHDVLPTLDENNLSEPAGVGGSPDLDTAFGPPPLDVWPAGGAIDWNHDNDSTDTGVSVDINNKGTKGCKGTGSVFVGFDDWANLVYDFRGSGDFGDGEHHQTTGANPEITYEDAAASSPDTDGDGYKDFEDDCPALANPDQADADHDGTGDACTGPVAPPPPPGGGTGAGPPPVTGAGATACSDHFAPTARFAAGKRIVRRSRGRLRISGSARDRTQCAGASGRLATVEVALARKSGKRCRPVSRAGRLGRARSCGRPVFLRATGTTSWRLTLPRLPHGTYLLEVRARDAARNLGTAVTRTVRL